VKDRRPTEMDRAWRVPIPDGTEKDFPIHMIFKDKFICNGARLPNPGFWELRFSYRIG
jgi:hypothetical protein